MSKSSSSNLYKDAYEHSTTLPSKTVFSVSSATPKEWRVSCKISRLIVLHAFSRWNLPGKPSVGRHYIYNLNKPEAGPVLCKLNGKWSCIPIVLFLVSTDHSKCFTTLVRFTHSHKHSHTDGRGRHPRHQLLIRSNLEFSILLKDMSKCPSEPQHC